MKNQKIVIAASAGVLLLLFALGAYFYGAYEGKKAGFLAEEKSEHFIRDYSPTIGAEDPTVYLVEFLDPECESCRAFHPFVKDLLAKHPDQLKLVVRYAPFHPNSKFAIKILEAARKQNKYWETLELLFKYQPEWGDHHNPNPELIWHYLPEVDVDVEQIRRDMNDPQFEKIIEQDMKDVMALNVRATPTFFVNGKPLPRFGYEELEQAVKAAIERKD